MPTFKHNSIDSISNFEGEGKMLDIIKQFEQEMKNVYKQNYDIITTPEKIAQEMVDMLPDEIFNPDTNF